MRKKYVYINNSREIIFTFYANLNIFFKNILRTKKEFYKKKICRIVKKVNISFVHPTKRQGLKLIIFLSIKKPTTINS